MRTDRAIAVVAFLALAALAVVLIGPSRELPPPGGAPTADDESESGATESSAVVVRTEGDGVAEDTPDAPRSRVAADEGQVRVFALDPDGRGVAGVLLWSIVEGERRFLGVTAGPGGVRRVAPPALAAAPAVGVAIEAAVPGSPLITHRLASAPLAGDEVRIAVPRCGRVVLTAEDARGDAVQARFTVGWTEPGADGNGAKRFVGPTQQVASGPGEITIPAVAARSRLSIQTRIGPVEMYREVVSPEGGEELRVVFALDEREVVLAGRAVDESGEPIADARLRVRFVAGAAPGTQDVWTNGTGRFHLVLPRDFAARQAIIVVLERLAPDGGAAPSSSATLELDRLPPGTTELGDIRFASASVLVRGRLVDASNGEDLTGTGLKGALAVVDLDAPGRPVGGLTIDLAPDGAFTVNGETDASRPAVVVDAPSIVPMQPVPFVPGERTLRVPLDRGGSVRASLVLDELLPPDSIAAELAPSRREPHAADPRIAVRLRARASAGASPGSMDLTWNGVPSGAYTLRVGLPGSPRPLAVVADVVVRSGEELRLPAIDLDDRLRAFRVTVVDGTGRVIPGDSGAVFPLPASRGGDLVGHPLGSGHVVLATDGVPVDLLVSVPGYRLAEVRDAAQDTTVVMEPEIAVVLRFVDRDGVAITARDLLVALAPAEGLGGPGDDRSARIGGITRPVRELVVPQSVPQPVGEGGVARVRVRRADRFLVEVFAVTRDGGGRERIHVTEVRLEGRGDGRAVTIPLPDR